MAQAHVQIGSTDMRMYRSRVLKQEAVVVALAHWEAGQEPPLLVHQPQQQRYQRQELCILGMSSTGYIVPFGLLATL
jgi:hypothetical protein